MHIKPTKHRTERGYTMIETIMYISILGILGVILAGYAQRGFARYLTGRTAQQIIDLKRAVLQYTAVKESYETLSISEMAAAKAIPLDMRDATTYAHHALGGAVRLGPAFEHSKAKDNTSAKATNKYMFYITFENVPKNSCAEILTDGQFYGDGGDIDSLIINNEVYYYENSFFEVDETKKLDNKITQGRLSVEQAVKACSKPNSNTITWIFS